MLSETAPRQNIRIDGGATIVIVTYNSAQTILGCLRSVENTLCPDDQVVLVDNRSKDHTLDLIREFVHHKEQFGLIENQANLGYAAAANQGAAAGSNPYIVFLNPDTIVTPHWLDQLVYHLQGKKIAAAGPLSDCVAGLQKLAIHLPAIFDAEIDPKQVIAMLRQKHLRQSIPTKLLVGFCLMIKRRVFDEVGGLDDHLFLGNDDLDICWRLSRAGYELAVAKDTVVFHKGQESFKSTAPSITEGLVQESTDYLYYKLMRHYGTGNIPSSRELWGMDWFRTSCRFEKNLALTSIIILTCDQIEYTRQCLNSLFKWTGSPFELIIVDNGSRDGTIDYLASLSRSNSACVRIKLIANEENQGFAKGCNQGLAEARGEYLLLLNNDVVVTAEWLYRLVGALDRHDRLGLVGPMTNYVSGPQLVSKPSYNVRTLEGLDQFAAEIAARHGEQVAPCSRVVGFCMLIKKEVIDAIGGLDECFGLGNFEDDDFCIRALIAGYEGAIAADCYVHHFGGRTFLGKSLDYRNRLQKNWELFKNKWNIPRNIPLGPKYQVSIPRSGFDPTKHFVPIVNVVQEKSEICLSESVLKSSDTNEPMESKLSLRNYCLGLNNGESFKYLDQLAEKSSKPPYMAILDDVVAIGPLVIHCHSNGRMYAVNIEEDNVSGNFSNAGVGIASHNLLQQYGPKRKGSYLMLWGLRTDNFWHWIMETMTKIIMARECGFEGNYIVPPKYNSSGFVRESLEIIGISPDRIFTYDGNPWRLERLYLPQWINGDYQLSKYPALIDRLREILITPELKKPHHFDRIYIARENPGLSRRVLNEIQLMKLLYQYDFHRVVMEQFSLQDQIAIASGARCIVAPHGAGMVHSLFMPQNSTVIELFPSTYINPCMLPVIKHLNFKYFMVPSSHLRVFKDDHYDVLIDALEVILGHELGNNDIRN